MEVIFIVITKYKINNKGRVNNTLKEIIRNYFLYSTPKELKTDWLFPATISFILFLYFVLFITSNSKLLNLILHFNNISMSIMAILAGFNTASLTVFASANKNELAKLYNTWSEVPQYNNHTSNIFLLIRDLIVNLKQKKSHGNILKVTVTFFAYAIIIQAFILIGGLIISLFANSLTEFNKLATLSNYYLVKFFLSLFGWLWTTLILHSLFITIRNITLLYRYILYLGKKTE